MDESLYDDVTSLLDGDFGDDRILKQIQRACKNNEVISNYERNYVQKLSEKHLGKKPKSITPKTIETPPKIPDTNIPKIVISRQTQAFEATPNRSNFNSKNSKLFLGFGVIGLIIILAAVIFSTSNTDLSQIEPTPTIEPTTNITQSLTIKTDLLSYSNKDLISISGTSTNSQNVNLEIYNSNNNLVWAEQLSVKSSGTYSTLAIAGGLGWESSGTYNLKVDNGIDNKSIKFSFNS